MRILVAFKVMPDLEAMTPSHWAGAPEGRVETRFVPRIVDGLGESALEIALRLRDGGTAAGDDPVPRGLPTAGGPRAASGAPALDAVSIGGREVTAHLETLLALGYGRALRVETPTALDFQPGAVAALLAATSARWGGHDLILLGGRGGPGGSGTVPHILAELMGLPCVTQVVEVAATAPGRLRLRAIAETAVVEATLRTPAVVGVGDAVVSKLRVPTLKMRLAAREKRVEVVSAADLGVDTGIAASLTRVVLTGLEVPARGRASSVIGGATARAKAERLFGLHLRGRFAPPHAPAPPDAPAAGPR